MKSSKSSFVFMEVIMLLSVLISLIWHFTNASGYSKEISNGEESIVLTESSTSEEISSNDVIPVLFPSPAIYASSYHPSEENNRILTNRFSSENLKTPMLETEPKFAEDAEFLKRITGQYLNVDRLAEFGEDVTIEEDLKVKGRLTVNDFTEIKDHLEVYGNLTVMEGYGLNIGGVDFGANLSSSSGASLIGLYDDSMMYISGNASLQDAIKQLDSAIGTMSGSAGGWTDGGTTIYLSTITDGVGIGTTTPNDKLEVVSTSDAQLRLAYDTNNFQALQVADDGGLSWSALGTDADLNLDFSGATDGDFSVNSDDLFVDTSEGRVGIGTTSPTAKLHLPAGTATAYTGPLKFTAGTLLTTPESGVMEYDGEALYFTQGGVRRYVTLGNDVRITDTIVTNTVTETTIHTSPLAAGELKAGRVYKVTLLGKTTTSSASDYFTLRFKMGNATLVTVNMTAKNVLNDHFRTECYITIRSTGPSGTYAAHVEGLIGSELITVTPISGLVDTTISEDLVTTLQWNSADPGNEFIIMQALLEVIG